MDHYGLPDSSVHGILQERLLVWVAVSFSRGTSLTQGSNASLLCPLNCQVDSSPLEPPGTPKPKLGNGSLVLKGGSQEKMTELQSRKD